MHSGPVLSYTRFEMFESIPLILLIHIVSAAALFGAAGRWDLPMAWAYMLVSLVLNLLGNRLIHWRNPDLLQERRRPGQGEQDRLTRRAFPVLLVLHLIIAGLDVGRFHWTGGLPVAVQTAGLTGFAVGTWLYFWAAYVNRFFSLAVRIQQDRGQRVITGGPYRFVRHPGYFGQVLSFIFSGLALGSWWSLLPILPLVAILIRRTALEDRLLNNELAGYTEYAREVRYRLAPGVW
jgi:protein-S-isoprenylcysteine O-methyltransferase Ste14